MIVVDVNVIAYALIQGEKTNLALKLRQKDPEWIVPSLWRHEFLNVLSTVQRAGLLSHSQCIETWESAFNIFNKAEHPVDMENALMLAMNSKISAYDAEYIALAQSHKVLCVTEDKKLLENFPQTAISIKKYLDSVENI